jgi:uncharacterized protein YdhG (YjbR/CyaY superfamily)
MTDQSLSYEQFLSNLPPERRGEVERVWQIVREHVPDGYHEEITTKFLTFKAAGEWYVALASQKNYISLYLTPIYVYPELRAKLDAGGKKLKCGKSCINFRRAEELPLEAIGEIVGASSAADYVEKVRSVRRGK